MTIWIASCATGPSEVATSVCPPVKEYSREFQVQMADELRMLPAKSAVREAIKDYKVMRDQAHVCH